MEKRLINDDDHHDLFGILPRLIKKAEAFVVTLNEITERLPIQKFGSTLSYHVCVCTTLCMLALILTLL